MRTVVKKFLLACPGFEALCRLLTCRHVRALLFHRFCAEPGENPRRLDRETLAWQARYLSANHSPWTPDQHLQAVKSSVWPGGRCPVVVTVDDGYRDFYEIAFPVFRARGIPVMFFVATDFVDGKIWFWWDKLEYVIERAESRVHIHSLGAEEITVDLATENGRSAAWHQVADLGRCLPNLQKEQLVERVAATLAVEIPPHPTDKYLPVSWEELAEMVSEGLLVGAHTQTHPILSRVELDEAREEIAGSQRALSSRLGRPVTWFCYPQGGLIDFTPEIRDLVSQYFDGCYVAYPTPADPHDHYTLPRSSVSADLLAFRWSLCGAEFLFERLRHFLGAHHQADLEQAGLGYRQDGV